MIKGVTTMRKHARAAQAVATQAAGLQDRAGQFICLSED